MCFCFFDRKDIIKISAGDRHTIALTSAGKVFAWGSGEHGQLGISFTQQQQQQQTLADNNSSNGSGKKI